MCKIENGFKFCTCATPEALKDAEFVWHLTRYKGENDLNVMGSIVGPSRDLGQGLTRESVLKLLNAGGGFDFDYAPAERDSFRISHRAPDGYRYMSFLYQQGQWSEGMNDTFSSVTEELANGKICPVDREV